MIILQDELLLPAEQLIKPTRPAAQIATVLLTPTPTRSAAASEVDRRLAGRIAGHMDQRLALVIYNWARTQPP